MAAQRLAENNIAVEKAKLAENVYKTTNPLKDTIDIPEGWKDISNNDGALGRLGLSSNMLYDKLSVVGNGRRLLSVNKQTRSGGMLRSIQLVADGTVMASGDESAVVKYRL